MGLAQDLAQIAQLQTLNNNIDELETANANIYLDSGDVNVAQTTLEMLIGGQASVLDSSSPHYKSGYIWGTNELLTSIKGSLGTIDDVVVTTPGQERLKVDIISATATLEVNTDSLEEKIVDITGSDSNFSDLFAVQTSIDNLRGTSTNISTIYDLKQSVDTLATETTIGEVKTNLDNLIYSNGSGYYIQAKDYNVLISGSDAPNNTPFTAIGGVDENDKSRVLKTTTSGELNTQLVTGTDSIGTVGLDAGVNSIGKVGLDAGTESIGKVGLNAGNQAIGTVQVTSAPTTAVTGTFWQTTQPVSGTFWQTTQPISHDGLTELGSAINADKVDVNLTNSTVAVTGTFYQATQPVSGTFWQTTQPISNSSLTELGNAINASNQVDVNLTNSSVAVTGSFWQATQPVSIAGTVEVIQDTSADLKVTESNSADIKTSVDSIRGASSNVSSLYDLKGVLDAIETNTDDLEVKVESVNVNTDTLETLQTSNNTDLALIKADIASIKTAIEVLDNAISGSEMQVDVLTMPTTTVTGTVTSNVGTGTQPISGTVTANVGTGTQDVSGTVAVTHDSLTELGSAIGTTNANELDVNIKNNSIGVTGTFYQGVQPVSGTFWQATQPISHSALTELGNSINASNQMDVNISSGGFDGSVTGTFWQTTQPVSVADTVEIVQDTYADLKVTEVNSGSIGSGINDVETSVNNLKGSGVNLSTLYDIDQELIGVKGFVQTTAGQAPKLTDIDSTLTTHTTNLDNIESHNLSSKNSLNNVDDAVTVSSTFKNGTETIGTSVGAMTSVNHSCSKGVTISVEFSNLGTIYVGYDSNVTSSNGFPLEAGDSMYLPIDNPNKVYCIADTAGQKVYWLAI